MSSTSPPPPKPATPETGSNISSVPVSKPEVKSLDDALKHALGANIDKPAPVDPDKSAADLKARFAGEGPDKFADDHLNHRKLTVAKANADFMSSQVEVFLQMRNSNPVIRAKVNEIASGIIRSVSVAAGYAVDFQDTRVEDLLRQELAKNEVVKWLDAEDTVKMGEVAMKELSRYSFYQELLKGKPEGTAIEFPHDSQHNQRTHNEDWLYKKLLAGDHAELENCQRLAKTGRQDMQALLDEVNLVKEWNRLDSAKQREVLASAADGGLARVGRLGERLLAEKQQVGLVLMTVSGKVPQLGEAVDKFVSDVMGLPEGKTLLQRFADIRQNGGEVRLTTGDIAGFGVDNTVVLDKNLQIKEITSGSVVGKVQFADYTKGTITIAKQMMGLELLERIPQRSF